MFPSRNELGYCLISWWITSPNQFQLSVAPSTTAVGGYPARGVSDACINDYVVIPGARAVAADQTMTTDVYCGNDLRMFIAPGVGPPTAVTTVISNY